MLVREAKKRREAAEAFAAAGRPELAERERAEGLVLDHYLPAQLSEDELAGLVRSRDQPRRRRAPRSNWAR